MRTLSLTQPWASLIAFGAKTIETRSWATDYRGLIAIHATVSFPRYAQEFASGPVAGPVLAAHGYYRSRLPLPYECGEGPRYVEQICLPHRAVVAVADLFACQKTCELEDRRAGLILGYTLDTTVITPVPADQLPFGDFTPGRYAWRLANIRRLVHPITVNGAQRLWDWNVDLEELGEMLEAPCPTR